MLNDSAAIEYLSNDVVFAKLNGKKDDSTTASDFNIQGYPTFVVIDPEGNEVDRIIGYMPAEDFLQTLEDYKAGIGTLDDLLAQAEDSTDRELYFKIADKYKYRGLSNDAESWYTKVISAGEPTDSMSAEGKFAIADMYLRNDLYDDAIDRFKNIKQEFDGEQLDEVASIYIPYTYMQKGDTVNAISNFELFIQEFPESEDVEYAEGKIKALKGETEN